MDETAKQFLKEKLSPPGYADVSTVVNGVGSGLMFVGAPIMLLKLFNKTDSNAVTKFLHSGKGAVFTTVLGCGAGAWFGIVEAKRTHEYRDNLANEIVSLRAEADATKQQHDNWAAKEDQRNTASKDVLAV